MNMKSENWKTRPSDKKGKTHLEILRRFTEKTVVLAFDRDEAGEKATQKALGATAKKFASRLSSTRA